MYVFLLLGVVGKKRKAISIVILLYFLSFQCWLDVGNDILDFTIEKKLSTWNFFNKQRWRINWKILNSD